MNYLMLIYLKKYFLITYELLVAKDLTRLYFSFVFALTSVEFFLEQSICASAWLSGPLNHLKHLPLNEYQPDGQGTHAPPIQNVYDEQLDEKVVLFLNFMENILNLIFFLSYEHNPELHDNPIVVSHSSVDKHWAFANFRLAK